MSKQVKNIGQKIVNIDGVALLPDEVADISDERVATPAIQALIKQGYISVGEKQEQAPAASEVNKPAASEPEKPAESTTNKKGKPAGDKNS